MAALLVCFVASTASAQFNRHRRRGTIIGGLAGAAIGAAIGDRNNREGVGAAIGGVTGAVIGSNIGANKDSRIEHSQHYHNPPRYTHPQPPHHYPIYPQPVYPQPAPIIVPVPVPVAPPVSQVAHPMTQVDVLNMLRSGLTESMVAAQIQLNGMSHALSVNDIIGLHQQGVSERLIDYMQANVVPSPSQVYPQSHSSYSMPSQTTIHSQPSIHSQPTGQTQQSVQLHDASGQSIMAPSAPFQPAN
ncbi:glycine zipper 2TM domain-containing protein [Stieleria marina]